MKEPETGKKENTGKSGYSITTWRLHLWCRHPEWLRTTQEFYNRIAEFYYNLLLDHTYLWELGSQQTLRELEIMSIPGRGGRIPSDPLPWQKVPLYFRRAAANEGIASAKSYISHFAQDEKIGRAEKLNAAVTYYKGMYQDFSANFCSACGHPVGTAPSPGAVAPPAVPAKRESPRLKASSGNGSITKMSGTRRKPWLLRMPIPDPHTGITVMKAVGTYVTREEAEAVRAEMMKRPATPYQDSTLQDCFRMFKESREYKGRSDKARELYDIAWKYLRPLWHFKIAALYAQDFQNILDKMADNGLSQSMLEKERTLISKLYRTAIGWRVVDANLASVLKVEGRKSPEREIFTDEQVTLILSQKNTPTGQMVIALLACGVRIYELLHFKHEDFHRTESGAYLIGGCKTEAGRNRIIPILDFGIPVFEHAYATSVENGPLFPNGKGGFWNEKNWRNRKFYPFLEEIGIQPNPYDENGKRKPEFAGKLATYTPYTTRHTYASLCDRAGVNKDILKRAVGHTPKSKTLDEVYLHPKATQMIEAFDKANQLVNDEVLTTTKA